MGNLTHGALFNGIAGFPLAAEWAGIETIWTCEIDAFCNAVSKKHFPYAIQFNDIYDLKIPPYVDIISGGFPCQPFSVAGKQKAQQDDRHLWPQMLRIITEVKPKYVIGENVTGIINLALDEVLASLEDQGYTCETFVLPACAVNAPHKRDRVWIVAYSRYIGSEVGQKQTVGIEQLCEEWDASNTQCSGQSGQGQSQQSGNDAAGTREELDRSFKRGTSTNSEHDGLPSMPQRRSKREVISGAQEGKNSAKQSEGICNTGNVADTEELGCEQSGNSRTGRAGLEDNGVTDEHSDNSGCAELNISRIACDAGLNNRGYYERIPGWENFPTQPPLCRRNDGISNRVHRIKSLGNAIVPKVAYQIFKAIKEIEYGE